MNYRVTLKKQPDGFRQSTEWYIFNSLVLCTQPKKTKMQDGNVVTVNLDEIVSIEKMEG